MVSLQRPAALACLATGVVALLSGCAGWVPEAGKAEPAVQHRVSEDDHNRIDELRVRGQLVRVTVTPKDGKTPAYDILPPSPGHDPSGEHPGTAGQRVWPVLKF